MVVGVFEVEVYVKFVFGDYFVDVCIVVVVYWVVFVY